MKPEAAVVAEILTKWGARADLHLHRNNSGALFDRQGRLVRFGLPGSGDIEGFLEPRGRFLTIECKTSQGLLTDHQKSYQAFVAKRGGVAIIARSEPHFAHEIQQVLEREKEITRLLGFPDIQLVTL